MATEVSTYAAPSVIPMWPNGSILLDPWPNDTGGCDVVTRDAPRTPRRLAVALAESCIVGGLGFMEERFTYQGRIDAALFSEGQSRIVISVAPDKVKELEKATATRRVPIRRLGNVGGNRLTIGKLVDLSLDDVKRAWSKGLE